MAAAAEAEKEARTSIPPIFGERGKRGGDQDGELVFHVLHDGLTALGTVWYRGQEIGIKSGSAYDQLSTDLTGQRWYEMTNEEQMNRFGQLMFGVGPWPYSAPDAADDDGLCPRAELQRSRTPCAGTRRSSSVGPCPGPVSRS